MTTVQLKCNKCKKTKTVEVSQLPKNTKELLNLADDNDFIGVVDFYYFRSLIFCSDECCNASKKKNGDFKKHL